jgi:aminoglycoside phosphotransferase (APT) family kinase protein
MQFVAGSPRRPEALTKTGVDAVVRAAVDALASLHALDLRDVGLADLEPWSLRQRVTRWRTVYERDQVRELPLLEEVGCWLEANCPADGAVALVHGDYHVGNFLFAPDPVPRVAAVVDWECCGVGDPLLDLGRLLATVPTGPDSAAFAQRYAQRVGQSVTQLPFYLVLGYFDSALVAEGAYANLLAGSTSPRPRELADLATRVPALLVAAARLTETRDTI